MSTNRLVIFDLVKVDGTGLVVYPDNIDLFSATDITTEQGKVIAWYSGDLSLDEYVYPAPAEPTAQPTAPTKLTRLEYMSRFSDDELAGIFAAAKQNVALEVWLEKFKAATDVDLTDPRTLAGLETLEDAGLLDEGRAVEIASG